MWYSCPRVSCPSAPNKRQLHLEKQQTARLSYICISGYLSTKTGYAYVCAICGHCGGFITECAIPVCAYVHVTHVTVAGVVVEVRSFRVCAYMYVCNSG